MAKPQLPTYSSPENTHFHPPFKAVLEEIIVSKKLSHIEVRMQYPSPTGPIDLVLFNKSTKKVILPIELKRSQSSVRGSGRRQARDYWGNLGAGCETQFYCVSNLELTELFRYDAHRPKTSAQQICIQTPIAGKLGTTPDFDFYNQLSISLSEILSIVTGAVTYSYSSGGFPEFQTNIGSLINNQIQWHKVFVPVCFEYIRGAATKITQLRPTQPWKDASLFISNPSRLLQLGRLIDFEHVFKDPAPDNNDPIAFAQSVLKEAYESGKHLGNGDEIAELVNEILAPTGLGIVETDAELAQLLAIVAKDCLGRDLVSGEEVLDPASGSGRLLTALPITAFPSISPYQIKAIEKEVLFAESLSLRLGLAFASVISPSNAPIVKISGIELITPAYLDNVRLIVMNPPYLSGVQSANIKGIFTNRIREITELNPILNIGQVALEILFLELVWHLSQEKTVIATVFPYQHLCRTSAEVVAFRKFLIHKFGLTHIVIYPRTGLFHEVIKQTVILVGKKGNSATDVKLIEVQKPVADVDMSELLLKLTAWNLSPTNGVTVSNISRVNLSNTAIEGWKGIFGIGVRVKNFITNYMSGFLSIGKLGIIITRGSVGNRGNTALTVFEFSNQKYPTVVAKIPPAWLRSALNTTNEMPRVLNSTSAPHNSFLPPPTAFINGNPDNLTLKGIIQEYLIVNVPNQGRQTKAIKSVTDIINNLKADQKDKGAGWVLVQRASRTKGEVGLLEVGGILISTNVPMIKLSTIAERELMTSWLLSVFGQLQFELYGTSQEGMRKLEIITIKNVLLPNFKKIPIQIENKLRSIVRTEASISFKNVQQRDTDRLWAELLNPSDPVQCVTQAFELFQEMVDDRIGYG